MEEIKLRYGTNPHQKNARVFVPEGKLPLKVLNGQASYINILDALYGWQLVSESEGGDGVTRGGIVQAHEPRGGGGGGDPLRRVPPVAVPAGRRDALAGSDGVCPGTGRGPDVFVRRFGGDQRHGGSALGAACWGVKSACRSSHRRTSRRPWRS